MKLTLHTGLAVLLLSTPFGVPALAQDTALVIGNVNYPNCPPNLPGAGVDLRNVPEMLRTAGWRIVDRGNQTRAEMLDEITNNIPAAPSAYLIYYSGHGVAGTGNLLGVDCNAVTPADFQMALGAANTNRTVVILDSCDSGTFAGMTQVNFLPAFLTATLPGGGCPTWRSGAGGYFTNAVRACALTGGPRTLQQIHLCLSENGGYDVTFQPHSYNATLPNRVIANAPGNIGCQPGAGIVMGCPCGNPPSELRRGCRNSSNPQTFAGAQIMAVGAPSIGGDSLNFATLNQKPIATSILLQGPAFLGNGVVFGQGVRCVGGALKRLYVQAAQSGTVSLPGVGEPSVHARSAQLGDPLAVGNVRHYLVYYRDPTVLGGCPAASTFNATPSVTVTWVP